MIQAVYIQSLKAEEVPIIIRLDYLFLFCVLGSKKN